jgi:hypothetical protein
MGYDLLADLIVLIHVGYVSYVILGQAAILLGWLRRWSWIRNPYFRLTHLAAIVIVAAESLLDLPCPLTLWEDNLRALAGHSVKQGSFIGRFLDAVLFYDFPPWVFTWVYVGFAALVVVTVVLAPPRRLSFSNRTRGSFTRATMTRWSSSAGTSPGFLPLAEQERGGRLPPAHRGGVGIRLSRWNHHPLLDGRRS